MAIAYRARHIIAMTGERASTGRDLLRPLEQLDNYVLVERDGRVAALEPYAAFQPDADTELRDLGEVTLMPATINAHCHLQLSHLAGRTLQGQGFVPWLRSLIALLGLAPERQAIGGALALLRRCGTVAVGDFTGAGAALVAEEARRAGVELTQFCEWFGFAASAVPSEKEPWPLRFLDPLRKAAQYNATRIFPAGHALYSTHPEMLRATQEWCQRNGAVFSLHLAESPEETELLTRGRGALVDLYRGNVLPEDWHAPGLPPVALAQTWGLLGPGTLAVHCVQCERADVQRLAASGTAVCLCPRSNAALAVGRAPVREMLETPLLLCLGTDGLSSNSDLDVREEALTLLREQDIPATALLRMLTVNGHAALQREGTGTLAVGQPCRWAVVPPDLAAALE